MGKIRIQYIKSGIGCKETHRRIIKALGLKRLNQSVVHEDSPIIRGMVAKVDYLVSVSEEK